MSSIDLHTQYSIQKDVPNAVGIVVHVDPTHKAYPKVEWYNLTQHGLNMIPECQEDAQQPHMHESADDYYEHSKHFTLMTNGNVNYTSYLRGSELPKMTTEAWKFAEPTSTLRSLMPRPQLPKQALAQQMMASSTATQPALQPKQSSNNTQRQPSQMQQQTPTQESLAPSTVTSHVSQNLPQNAVRRADIGRTPVLQFEHQYERLRQQSVFNSDRRKRAVTILGGCSVFLNLEQICSIATTTVPGLRDNIINAENRTLEALTCGLSTSVLYVATFLVKNKYLYTRWIDGGDLGGFVKSNESLFKNAAPSLDLPIMWQVSTESDVTNKIRNYRETLHNKRQKLNDGGKAANNKCSTGMRWEQVIGDDKKQNKKCLHKSITNLDSHIVPVGPLQHPASIRVLGTLVHIDRKKERKIDLVKTSKSVYSTQNGIYKDIDMSQLIDHHKLHRPLIHQKTFEEHVDQLDMNALPNFSLPYQEEVINSIENDSHTQKEKPPKSCYFSTSDYRDDDKDDTEVRNIYSKYPPTSKRNKAIYHWMRRSKNLALETLEIIGQQSNREPPHQPSSPPRKTATCRRTEPLIQLTPNVPNSYDVPQFPDPPHISEDRPTPAKSKPYVVFVQTLISPNGVLQWRHHDADNRIDVLAMNDVNSESGKFMTNSFVHLTRHVEANGTVTFHCTCRMHDVIGGMPDTNMSKDCCHARFFNENLQQHMNLLFCSEKPLETMTTMTPMIKKITEACKQKQNPIVRLDHSKNCHRFSVRSEETKSFGIVHLQDNRFTCQSGRCRAIKANIRKTQYINDNSACPHLKQMHANKESWKDLVPRDGHPEVEDDDIPDQLPADDSETQDLSDDVIQPDSEQNFDPATGQWRFHSLSSHHPYQQEDSVYLEAASYRSSLSDKQKGVCLRSDDENPDKKYLMKDTEEGPQPFILCPPLNKEQDCQCGSKYWSAECPDGIITPRYSKPTNVFCQHGVAKFLVHDRHCMERRQECIIKYSGRQDALHFLTECTAAGDEIGWKYVNSVSKGQQTITAFCENITAEYYATKVRFMSRDTFTKWIFSWLSNFQTEFREPCPRCKYNLKVLGCDGTKIGMFLNRASELIPIEIPTSNEDVQPCHTRSERQFFSYTTSDLPVNKTKKRLARCDLEYFVAKKQHSSNNLQTNNRSEEERKSHLLSQVPIKCRPLMEKFIDRADDIDQKLMLALCPIFKILASDKALTSLFCYQSLDLLQSVLKGEIDAHHLKDDMPEICDILLIAKAATSSVLDNIHQFFEFIIDRIVDLHSNDRTFSPPQAQPTEEYNPEKTGCAYYFTEHGGRVRQLPKYNMGKVTSANSSTCKKHYYEASKGGTTYLFVWFCALHGHCYGYHIIKESEGRKDPFASAFSYMNKCPDVIFYDFGCQLEEYCLNREPGFFRNCRFFVDIFHGYSHKCPEVYNSRRIESLKSGVNSSICEQFNSYLQKIKYSARSMSRSHFIFYLQYFIHRWNKMKLETIEREEKMVRLFSN